MSVLNSSENVISVLLADDDEDDQKLFRDAIYEVGLPINLQIVSNGVDLLARFTSPMQELPNILFLDINMPRKSGLQCLAEIREMKSIRHLPIVIYSTSSYKPDIEESFSKGANLYFMKPNSFVKLVNNLKDILNLDWNVYSPNNNFDNYIFIK